MYMQFGCGALGRRTRRRGRRRAWRRGSRRLMNCSRWDLRLWLGLRTWLVSWAAKYYMGNSITYLDWAGKYYMGYCAHVHQIS